MLVDKLATERILRVLVVLNLCRGYHTRYKTK